MSVAASMHMAERYGRPPKQICSKWKQCCLKLGRDRPSTHGTAATLKWQRPLGQEHLN